MAIQFRCPGCAQPIEVDEVYAEQTAACPYCRRVVNVPAESQLDESPIAARPAAESDSRAIPGAYEGRVPSTPPPPPPPPSAPPGLHVGDTVSYREKSARTFGNYALICTVLTMVLFGGAFVYSASVVMPELTKNPGSQPTREDMAVAEAKLRDNPWAGAGLMGGVFFAVVGLAFGTTSLVQGRRANWRAVVSVVLCGLAAFCVCASFVVSLASGVAPLASIL